MKGKMLVIAALAGGLIYSTAFAAAQGAGTGMDQVNSMTGSQKTPNQILRDINAGNSISEEDAVTFVMSSGFMNTMNTNPQAAKAIAKHPFASNMFYNSTPFKAWSAKNPDEAKAVVDASLKWDKMSAEEKAKFFLQHPSLKAMMGSMQGGAQGGAQGGMMGGTTEQMKTK